jgi:pimeloyl-ACP methyl ester carboxylesterase
MRPLVSAIAALTCVLAGCSGDAEPRERRDARPVESRRADQAADARTGPLASFYGQQLAWRGCRRNFECARLTVPVDYEQPDGATIDLAVVRLPASGDDRIGSLVVNPGGPGASGVDYARAADSIVTSAVRERYDVVGFDPRGVQRSAPIECLTDRELDSFLAADGSPDSADEEQVLVREGQVLAAGCIEAEPELAANMSTRAVARDLDILRAALGDRRLTYLGKSYGTYIGATYAGLFPRQVGRLVLDGALDPSLSGAELAAGQAGGFQQAFDSFLADCLPRRSCPFSGSARRATRQADRLLDAVDAQPLRGFEGRQVTQALAVLGIAAALYDKSGWPLLRDGLREAGRGSGDTLLALADYYSDRGPNGYTTNAIEAQYAVNCLDRPEPADLAEFRRQADELADRSPLFGAFVAWGGLPCADWPVAAAEEPAPIVARGARPILVVGTTRDPATPYAWARALAGQLDSGRLLTFVGDGHTAYRSGSRCVDEAVDAYLLRSELPPRGTRCR